jgi:hypothetical protein
MIGADRQAEPRRTTATAVTDIDRRMACSTRVIASRAECQFVTCVSLRWKKSLHTEDFDGTNEIAPRICVIAGAGLHRGERKTFRRYPEERRRS